MRKLFATLALVLLYSGSLLADLNIVQVEAASGTYGPTASSGIADPPDFESVSVNPGDVVVLVTATNKPYANVTISYATDAPTSSDGQFDTSGYIAEDGFQTYLGYFQIATTVTPGSTYTFQVNSTQTDNVTVTYTMHVLRADSGEIEFMDVDGNEWRALAGATTYPFSDDLSLAANDQLGQVVVVGGGSSRRGILQPTGNTLVLDAWDGDITDITTSTYKRVVGSKAPASNSATNYSVTWSLDNQGDTEHGSTLSAAFAEVPAATPQYTVGGTVAGLNGELKLTNNGGDEISVTSDGSFTFPTALDDGSAYSVAITQTPATQTCSLTNGSGTLSGANVTNVEVTCADVPTYSIGGAVTGLNGTLVLRNNGGDDLSISADGSFTFATELLENDTYAVTILSEPATQTCTVSNGSGTVGTADVTSVAVTCADAVKYAVNVELSGLAAGESVTLQNNGADNLVLSADGTTPVANTLADGAAYAVTVFAQPASQDCTVTGGSGNIAGADVTVPVACADVPTYAIGGTVSGLTGDVTLLLNGGSALVVSADGAFAFADELKAGDTYSVTVGSSPSGQTCSVTSGGTGTVGSADVTSVVVECVEDSGPPPSYDPVASDVPTLSRFGLLVMILTLGLAAIAYRRYF